MPGYKLFFYKVFCRIYHMFFIAKEKKINNHKKSSFILTCYPHNVTKKGTGSEILR